MRTLCILTALLLGLATQPLTAQEDVSPIETIGSFDIVDPAAKELVDPSAKIERLATGFQWSEGPVWIREGGFLVFSDVPRNTVFKWKEGEGLSVYLKPSGYTGPPRESREPGSNGLALDPKGRLLLCQHGDRQVGWMDASVLNPQAKYRTLAGNIDGKEFNSPNDLVVHSSGAVYFTDPPYGRIGTFKNTERPLDYQGVYRVAPGEPVQLLTKELRAPNGIALSPDERTLYVAQSDGNQPIFMAYPVADDGSLKQGRLLFDAKALFEKTPGNPDGMTVDSEGNLFATGPGGVLILTPEGKHLATIRTGDRIANCAFGDDGHTLYMTSNKDLCRVRVKAKGLGF